MLAVLIWWLVLQVIALAALPITLKLFRFLPDRGWGFARPVGLVLTGYLFWLLVTFGVLQNSASNIVLVLFVVVGCSAYLWAREGREMLAALRERKRIIVITEIVFAVALAGFALFRAYNPEISATEKPMEFAFINGILRSRAFPPRDPWLSGYSISYYYFGYVIAAMLTRLSGLPSDITFNLTLTMLFALTVTGAFSLVYNMAQAYLSYHRREDASINGGSRGGVLAGLLGSVFVALMGNLEGIFELLRAHGGGSEALWRWLDVKNLQATAPSSTWYPNDLWWWWRASRVIHDKDALGNSVEVIDEFPFFSFLLGDNHPHVLALPFVLLALALALNLLLSWRATTNSQATPRPESGLGARIWQWVNNLWNGGPFDVALWALLLGSLGFFNTWDYPIYLGIFALVYAIRRQGAHERIGWPWVADVVAMGVILLVMGVAFYFPFYFGFRSQAGGIGWVGATKTRLHQYLLMLGIFIVAILGLLTALGARFRGQPAEERRFSLLAQIIGGAMVLLVAFAVGQRWWTAAFALALAGLAAVLLIWASQLRPTANGRAAALEDSSLFALLLIIAGLLLTASVEFIFLRDTFGTRMNTVFKFYYQAWVLLGLASAYGVFYVAERARGGSLLARGAATAWGIVTATLVICGLSYTVAAATAKAGGFAGRPTLDGTRYIEQYRPDDYAAIQWLRANAALDAVMLEATGGSYTEYNWISAHTGIPTLLGWGGHELQWRGNYDEPARREPDIQTIYKSVDAAKTQALLDAYGIDYVYVGQLERAKYGVNQAVLRKFDRMMTRVFEQGNVVIYARSGQ